ncbi:hypothetical protein GCM10023324_22340 [Streptomyces youssoufiensis]
MAVVGVTVTVTVIGVMTVVMAVGVSGCAGDGDWDRGERCGVVRWQWLGWC